MPIDTPIPPGLPAIDANGDGASTLADAGAWLLQAYFLPGDAALWLLAAYLPSVAHVFGVGSTPDYGGLWSGVVSGFAWLAVCVLLIIAYDALRAFDRRLTGALTHGWREALRRMRVRFVLLGGRWRRRRGQAPSSGVDLVEDLALAPEELELLRAHFELEPGYALHASDAARRLDVRTSEACASLERLAGLGLLGRTLGGDGEAAYTLSAAGRGYLVFRQLAEPRRAADGRRTLRETGSGQ